MKKSEIYLVAQACVLRDERITEAKKLEVLRELFSQEDLAVYCEMQKEKENAE